MLLQRHLGPGRLETGVVAMILRNTYTIAGEDRQSFEPWRIGSDGEAGGGSMPSASPSPTMRASDSCTTSTRLVPLPRFKLQGLEAVTVSGHRIRVARNRPRCREY